jgi:methionine synthase II (cobalamin-independent)
MNFDLQHYIDEFNEMVRYKDSAEDFAEFFTRLDRNLYAHRIRTIQNREPTTDE